MTEVENDETPSQIVIVTRHGNPLLYKESQRLVSSLPFARLAIVQTTGEGYLQYILQLPYKWVINMDDDLFVFRPNVIFQLLKHMEEKGFDMCGIPDGGNATIRGHLNPAAMNPFFNIMNVENIRRKLGNIERVGIEWSPSLIARVPDAWKPGGSECPHTQLGWQPKQEDYYTFFFHLLRDVNVLFLRAETAVDDITTVVKDLEGQHWAYHTWYSRAFFPEDPNNLKRINNVISLANTLLLTNRSIQSQTRMLG